MPPKRNSSGSDKQYLTSRNTIDLDHASIRVACVLATVAAVASVADGIVSVNKLLAGTLAVIAREEDSTSTRAGTSVLRSGSGQS